MRIHFCSDDGSELEEQWPSPDAFASWAIGECLSGSYTVYEEDEDGDWLITLKGVVEAVD